MVALMLVDLLLVEGLNGGSVLGLMCLLLADLLLVEGLDKGPVLGQMVDVGGSCCCVACVDGAGWLLMALWWLLFQPGVTPATPGRQHGGRLLNSTW
uniref:Candidate secreted effector n=1 Tax=Meloidogyne incognita TaxID=6306 RepID=A0A914KPV1_MELIC